MGLLLTYLVLALIGNAVIYVIGLGIEQVWPVASLPAFLLLFFLVLWISWVISVKLTEPKVAEAK